MSVAIAALAAAAVGQFQYLGPAHESERPLATPAPYVASRATNWAHVPEMGRPWEGRMIVSGVYHPEFPWGGPGPAAYGADEYDFSLYWARVGNVVVPAHPWVAVPGPAFSDLEEARQLWLREQGYVNRPRVFRNPMHELPPAPALDEPMSLKDRYEWRTLEILVPRDPSFEVRAQPQRSVHLAGRKAPQRRVVVRRGIGETAVVVRGSPAEGRVVLASR